jgi:hypothetical protein
MNKHTISKMAAALQQVAESKLNEFEIPETIQAAERTAFHGAAAGAHKAGKSHFNFSGKKYPVTMKKDTANAIADQKENKGDGEEVIMNPKKDKKDKKDPNIEAEMATEETVNELDKKTLGSYIKKAGVDREVQKAKAARHADAGDMADKDKDMYKHYTKSQRAMDKSNNRVKGINKAVDKLTASYKSENSKASLMKKIAKAAATTEKGKAAVTLPKAPFEIPKKESVEWPVYSRIMEKRADHYKSATAPEDWNEKEKNNAGSMKMKADMKANSPDVIDMEKDGHDDASKAARSGPATKARSNDNKAGDKKIINPAKGVVTKET